MLKVTLAELGQTFAEGYGRYMQCRQNMPFFLIYFLSSKPRERGSRREGELFNSMNSHFDRDNVADIL